MDRLLVRPRISALITVLIMSNKTGLGSVALGEKTSAVWLAAQAQTISTANTKSDTLMDEMGTMTPNIDQIQSPILT